MQSIPLLSKRALSIELLFVFLVSTLAPAALAHHTETSPVRIDALDVSVIVDHHYAVTLVTETLTNPSDTAYEFSASIAAPEKSFVTRFALETGGHTYESRVEERNNARALYDAGVASASAGAIVESRDTHNYQVSLNIPARTTVIVHLAYEEMVLRSQGQYVYRFPLMATVNGHSVGALTLSGSVSGSATITAASSSYGTPALTPSSTAFALSSSAAYEIPAFDFGIVWKEGVPECPGTLIANTTPAGTAFVHTFSPECAGLDATPIPKDIVFVIDVSGSMEESLPQVKTVFSAIIGDLSADDRLDVVAFSESLGKWSDAVQPASTANIQSARAWVEGLSVESGTDIDSGLALGESLLPAAVGRAPILVFLSDGEPTVGETRPEAIRSNVAYRNTAHASVHTLAFGPHADFGLMQAIALENNGQVRRIWLDGDANAQIRGFYDSISTPLLSGVTVSYDDGTGRMVVVPYATAYLGADLVTAGLLAPGTTTVSITVAGQSASGPVTFTQAYDLTASQAGAYAQRAAAYERIRALEGRAALGDLDAHATIVAIALDYGFVTDYTSLVVVVPATLVATHTEVQQPMLLTNSGVLTSAGAPNAGSYTASNNSRAAPGPDALLAGAALAACAFVVQRRRASR